MRILALSSWWPEPADNGARLRISCLLRELACEHEVHLIAFIQEAVTPEQQERVRSMCASVQVVPQTSYTPQRHAAVASLWHAEPASIRATYNPIFAAAVQERAAVMRPHVVIAFELAAAPYARLVPHTSHLFEEVEVTVLWEQFAHAETPLHRARHWLTWTKHRHYMQQLLQHFDACTVVSTAEQEHVRRIAPRLPITVLPNGADAAGTFAANNAPEADTLIYPGALSYSANRDAIEYFVRQILPLIRQARPNVCLRVTGRTTAADRAQLSAPGLEWTGYVPDIRSLIAQMWAEVVPLRIGGGTRLKVLEALATGTPVVSTSKGVEGLAVRDGQHVLIADTPAAFAAATLRLLESPTLRSTLVEAGRKLIDTEYDWRRIGAQFRSLITDVAAGQR